MKQSGRELVAIGGKGFELTTHAVGRKCWDMTKTPTALIRMDGKRISYKSAMAALA